MEQEKREKLVTGRHQENKEEQRAKEQSTKGEMVTVKEKSTKEVGKEKAGKRLITPEKAKADKKQKASAAGNLPREALAPLTNRFRNHSFLEYLTNSSPAPGNLSLPLLPWQRLPTLLLTLHHPSGVQTLLISLCLYNFTLLV